MSSEKTTSNDVTIQGVRSIINRVFKDRRLISTADGSAHDIFPVAVDVAEGEALRSWIIKEKAVHTIEIGLAYGISTLFICEGLLTNGDPGARHIALDPYQDKFKNFGLQVLKEAGIEHLVEHITEESQIALPRFVSEGRSFDFAFVDGSHLFDRVFLDLIYLGGLVRLGGIIFADDYQAPAVARAVSFCLNNLGWKIEEKSPSNEHHQWIVLRTASEPVQRSYPHFVDF